MNLQEFIAYWTDKYCEVGGSANAINQCVDLANAYIRDVLKQEIILWTNAQDFPLKADKNVYDYILNTPTNIPNPGDIVIWKSKDGVGHIAIFLEGGTELFKSFDQNWPLGSKCHIQSHSYTTTIGTNVIGWLRCKIKPVSNSDESMTQEETNILKFLKEQGANEGKVREAFGALVEIPRLNKEVDDLKSSVIDLQKQIDELSAKLTESEKTADDWQSQLKSANKTIQSLNEDLNYYKPYKALYEKKLQETADKLTVQQLFALIVKKLTKK